MKTYTVTTPIYYVNDVPHVGHAYTTIAADSLTRALRLRGERVFFLTGTDEHGQNIERVAREKNLPEQAYCDEIAERFKGLWRRLGIDYDRFIRTTDAVHKAGVLKLWGRLVTAKGPDGRPVIYKDKYAGWYCPRCEAFKTEGELKQPGNVCPDHERPCEWTEEENLFFRLSAYESWLRDAIARGEILVEPESRRNEVLAVVNQGLKDFSVSRARVKWGIPVPESSDPALHVSGHVFYVWVDALSNYITALGYAENGSEYQSFWEGGDVRMHLIGKEIIRFHCLYWPAMLHAAGIPRPTRLFAHGWLTKGGRKLSKTTGNVIDPDVLAKQYGVDAVRYFFLREGSFGQDWDFTDAAFLNRYNADLANDLGNLVSRTLTMATRFCDGKVPARVPAPAEPVVGDVLERIEGCDFAGALSRIWETVSRLNQAIVEFAPWVAAKDPQRKGELDAFLYRLLESLRLVTVHVWPVMPGAASRVLGMMGLDATPGPADLAWGRLEPGRTIGPVEPLFPRAEKPTPTEEMKVKEILVSETPANAPADPGPARIEYDDFAKVELKVGLVKAAEAIPGAKKLLKLQVDLGTEIRQIVAGIALAYAPDTLVGRKIAVVANLKPAKLMGVESNGMLLAASIDGKPVLCTFDADVPPGTIIK